MKTDSSDSSQTPAKRSLILTVQGKIPGFKNRRWVNKQGKIKTDRKTQKRMDEITQSFVSQLQYLYREDAKKTSTTCSKQSWIASCMPEDDSWLHINELRINGLECPKGKDSAVIVIKQQKSL